jgi:hypothetical protein
MKTRRKGRPYINRGRRVGCPMHPPALVPTALNIQPPCPVHPTSLPCTPNPVLHCPILSALSCPILCTPLFCTHPFLYKLLSCTLGKGGGRRTTSMPVV